MPDSLTDPSPLQRHLPLSGGCNFRDLGGYRTPHGMRVRWGQVFRSGVLDGLSEADHAVLAPLGVQSVIDLRTDGERALRPSRLPGAWPAAPWARSHGSSGGNHQRVVLETTADEMRASMVKVYRRMPFEQADAYREIFQRIADGALPLLFHCHGGKDRTGVVAALLLDLLGVPRPVVMHDYALTNQCLARDRRTLGGDAQHAMPDDEAVRAPMMTADPAYLAQTFAKLEKDFGSVEGYLDQHLGIGATVRAAIGARLLEPDRPTPALAPG